MKQIEIHIEELVLHGFPPQEKYRIGEALQAALHNHFEEKGLPPVLSSGGYIPVIDSGTFDMHSTEQPRGKAENIAATVYKGFSNEG